jgi:glycosyltransferase involved in cell wall biosynthesis
MPPKVSVVIPTYRHRDYILETLTSVFRQTFQDYEVIVVNDGSPDDTAQVLAPLVCQGRIRYLEQPNAGQGAARNRGIREAQGQYVALLDDDDLWPPDKLAWQVQALEAAPEVVLVFGPEVHFRDGDVRGEAVPRVPAPVQQRQAPAGDCLADFLRRNRIMSVGQTLIRGAALRALGGFDEAIWGADDYELFLRLARRGRFVFEPHVALFYRRHPHNASRNVWRLYKNCCAVRHKHLGVVPPPRLAGLWWTNLVHYRRSFARKMIAEAVFCVRHGRGRLAAGLLGRALWIWPASGFQPLFWWGLAQVVAPRAAQSLLRWRHRPPATSPGVGS